MARRLAEKIVARGGRVETSAPVGVIRHDPSGVEFETKDGRRFRGRYAILTGTPVALSTHITWSPPLPAGNQLMLSSARIGNYNKHYAFFNQGPVWRSDPTLWARIQNRSVMWPMVYTALPPLPADDPQMPNGTHFFPSHVIDNSPATVDTGDPGCPNGAGALFSFGWPENGTTATARAQGWYSVLAGIPGLPKPSSVVGQAWAEEPYVMGAYGAWWPPKVLSVAKEQFAAVPGGRVFFAGTEWSAKSAGYMNGAIHNGRRHGDLVLDRLRRAASDGHGDGQSRV